MFCKYPFSSISLSLYIFFWQLHLPLNFSKSSLSHWDPDLYFPITLSFWLPAGQFHNDVPQTHQTQHDQTSTILSPKPDPPSTLDKSTNAPPSSSYQPKHRISLTSMIPSKFRPPHLWLPFLQSSGTFPDKISPWPIWSIRSQSNGWSFSPSTRQFQGAEITASQVSGNTDTRSWAFPRIQ